jgi:hypothetical protein
MAGSNPVGSGTPPSCQYYDDPNPITALAKEKVFEAEMLTKAGATPAQYTTGFDQAKPGDTSGVPGGDPYFGCPGMDGKTDSKTNADGTQVTPPPPVQLTPDAQQRLETLKQAKALRDCLNDPNNGFRGGGRFGGMGGSGVMIVDGKVDVNKLKEIVADTKGQSAVARDAAQYFIDHPDLFNKMDTADKGGSPDGFVGVGDLDKTIKNLEGQTKVDRLTKDPRLKPFQEAMQVLSTDYTDIDGASGAVDNKVSMDDFDKVIANKDGKFDDKEVAMAKFFKSNPDLFKMIDNASDGGDTDGVASLEDVNAMLELMKNQPAQPNQPNQPNQPAPPAAPAVPGSPPTIPASQYSRLLITGK